MWVGRSLLLYLTLLLWECTGVGGAQDSREFVLSFHLVFWAQLLQEHFRLLSSPIILEVLSHIYGS